MRWIQDYQLFLFDFDGLLVNTEEIHYLAYKNMLAKRNYHLPWDFNRYCQAAHYSSDAIKEGVYGEFPDLLDEEPDWAVLYNEKRQHMLDLLNEGAVHMMPGTEKLLAELEKHQIKRCVVTHSPSDLINICRAKNPILDSIPFWITREDYSIPKPDPECYKKAISKYKKDGEKVIGFEDTPSGLTALMQTEARPVLICKASYPEIPDFISKGVAHFQSFEDLDSETF